MQIHPQLVSLYRMSRFVNGLLLTCSILFVAIAVLGALLAYTLSFPPAWVLTVLGIGGALLLHRFRTRWKEAEKRKFQVGGDILTHTGSRPMILQYKGTLGFQGPMAILREQGGESGSGAVVVAALHVSKFHYPPVGESPVELFHRPPEPTFLFRRKGKLFFGTAFDRDRLAKEARKMKQLFNGLLVIVVIAFLAGAGFMGQEAYQAAVDSRFAKESRNWPKTTGKVVKSEVVQTMETSNIKKSKRVFKPVVRYSYQTADGQFTGERISWVCERFRRKADAVSSGKKYRPGEAVTVYYSPQNPAISVLEVGQETRATQRYHHLLMGTAAMLFTGSMVFALLWFLLVKRLRKDFDRMFHVLSGQLA